jgi:hypothetical protein
LRDLKIKYPVFDMVCLSSLEEVVSSRRFCSATLKKWGKSSQIREKEKRDEF